MKQPTRFDEFVITALTTGYYEPVKSTRDRSVREMKLGPHYIWHRFGWPGGITAWDMMRRNVSANNPLLHRMLQRDDC